MFGVVKEIKVLVLLTCQELGEDFCATAKITRLYKISCVRTNVQVLLSSARSCEEL